MKTFWFVAVVACIAGANACYAQEAVDKAKAATFDNRMFAGPLGQKTYACFVRRYDASHLAQHPKQKVSAMTAGDSGGCAGRQDRQLLVPPRFQISPSSWQFRLQRLLRSCRCRKIRQRNPAWLRRRLRRRRHGVAMSEGRQVRANPAGANPDMGAQQPDDDASNDLVRRRRRDFPRRSRRAARMRGTGDRSQGARRIRRK